ncbi:MAG: hypothetical protein KF723_01540 [Rhizobiaceae bacterium]|nr:hypothetical protein [Rhizobiaceae bacterium]
MPPAISQTRLANARALMAFEMPTFARVAACMGIDVTTLQKYAAREMWTVADHRRGDVRAAHEELRERLAGRALPVTAPADADDEEGVPGGSGHGDGDDGAFGPDGAPGQGAADGDDETFAALPPDEQLARIGTLLSRQASRILATAEASGGVLTKAQIEALSALIRLTEKFETLAAERAADKQTRSDAEIAGLLQRVDERIVELARGHAARLGRAEPDG